MLTVSIISIKVLHIFLSLYNSNFPDSSVGKASACNAGDPGSISGVGKSPGEGIGYPLQYSWASFVAQLVKNPPAIRETWEAPLEKGKATHSGILAWRIPGIYSPWDRKESDTTEQLSTAQHMVVLFLIF